MIKRLASTCVLVVGVAAFAGSASAGDGNGKGKHDPATGAPAGADAAMASGPGNSANAPGQVKKEAAAAAIAPIAAPSESNTTEAQAGVKPASDTEKDTHAAASSDETKLYGNGKTAGQIAKQNGAPGATILHGPGNSQPHKVAACAGGHEVDVHALKSRRHGKGCGSRPPAVDPDRVPDPNPDPRPGPNPGGSTSVGGNRLSSGGSATAPDANTPGATASPSEPGPPKPASGVKGSERVLAATAVAGRSGSLPFTGFPLWVALLVGIGLILAGLWLLRRTVEATE